MFKENQPGIHAELVVAMALLKAFRPLEILLIGSGLLGIASTIILHAEITHWLGLGIFLTGLAGLYAAFRMRIDAVLFARWENLDPVALDQVLQRLNPQFKPGRTLESRLAGAYFLLKAGIGLTIVQCALLVALAGLAPP